MYKHWLQLVIGALVIFFAGKNFSSYSQFFLTQADIKVKWIPALLWEIFKAFPECCILIYIIGTTRNPLLGLGTILGIVSLHLVIIALFLYNRSEELEIPMSFWFLLGFVMLLSISIGSKMELGVLKVGLASILVLGSYVIYFRIRVVDKNIPAPQLSLKPVVIYIRFFIAFLLIMAGAGQISYAVKEIISLFHFSPTMTGALFLAPIACLPRFSTFFSKKMIVIEEVMQSSILILGIFVFLIDFFYLREAVFVQATFPLFYLSLETLFLSLLFLLADY